MISYGSGALITITCSLGILLVLGGAGIVPINLQTIAGVVLSIFGIYSIVYSVFSKDLFYHTLWGGVSIAIGAALLTSPVVNPTIMVGIALIFISIVGAIAALKKR
ncbi:MAG: hypothetical protein QW059_01705 [Nitrososphaerota archaeon]